MHKVKKGTELETLCCGRKYTAQYDFTPKHSPLKCNGKTYVVGPCFRCKLHHDILPALAKQGIVEAHHEIK